MIQCIRITYKAILKCQYSDELNQFSRNESKVVPGGSKRQPELRTCVEEKLKTLRKTIWIQNALLFISNVGINKTYNHWVSFQFHKMEMMICSCFSLVRVSNEKMNINNMPCNLLLRICLEPWVREHTTFNPISEALSFPIQGTCPSICGEEQRRRKHTSTQPPVPLN